MDIALFQFKWPLQIHTMQMFKGFLDAGYNVHLYLYDIKMERFISERNISDQMRSRIHLITGYEKLFTYLIHYSLKSFRLLNKININSVGNFIRSRGDINLGLIVFFRLLSKQIFRYQPNIDLCLGVEKGGMIWASEVSKTHSCPCIYYSLELYTNTQDLFLRDIVQGVLRVREKKIHKNVHATIIADEDRRDALYASNNISTDAHTIIFPISVSKQPLPLDKPVAQKKILNFGWNRFTKDELVVLATQLPPDYFLLFHGQDFCNTKNLLAGINNAKILVNEKYLDEDAINLLISDSYICLCMYEDSDVNLQLTAFSSEKISRYLKSGKPIISRNIGNYHKLFSKYRCGIAIDDVSEIACAVSVIEENYSFFSREAKRAYEDIYCFESNFLRCKKYIEDILVKPGC